MPNPSRLQIAKADIAAFFDSLPRVMRKRDVAKHLQRERAGWRLSQKTTVDDFLDFLHENGRLRIHRFDFPHRPEVLYSWGEASDYELLMHLKPRSYLTHFTALRIHGLTEQVPKTFYVTHERSSSPDNEPLTQAAIDAAFAREPRLSTNEAPLGKRRVLLLNGASTGEAGVVRMDLQHAQAQARVRVTNIERTLIDAVVRPFYCGGVFEVAKAFEQGKGTVSVNALAALLKQMDFTYPHHQAIGYYLERAGYRPQAVDLLRRLPMAFDFYLAHGLGETDYVPRWRLHVPKGF